MQNLVSALTESYLSCGALAEALQLATGASEPLNALPAIPTLKVFNMLLAALARDSRLVDVIMTVNVMHVHGFQLDNYSFSAIITACQRSSQNDLAFEVYRHAPLPRVIPAQACCNLSWSVRPQQRSHVLV